MDWGLICSTECQDPRPADCGLFCADSNATCTSQIIQMVTKSVISVAKIGGLIATGGASSETINAVEMISDKVLTKENIQKAMELTKMTGNPHDHKNNKDVGEIPGSSSLRDALEDMQNMPSTGGKHIIDVALKVLSLLGHDEMQIIYSSMEKM